MEQPQWLARQSGWRQAPIIRIDSAGQLWTDEKPLGADWATGLKAAIHASLDSQRSRVQPREPTNRARKGSSVFLGRPVCLDLALDAQLTYGKVRPVLSACRVAGAERVAWLTAMKNDGAFGPNDLVRLSPRSAPGLGFVLELRAADALGQSLALELLGGGRFILHGNGQESGDQTSLLPTLQSAFTDRVDHTLLFLPHPNVSIQEIVAALDLAVQAEVDTLQLLVSPPPGQGTVPARVGDRIPFDVPSVGDLEAADVISVLAVPDFPGQRIVQIGATRLAANLIDYVEPVYPQKGREAGAHGEVILRIVVDDAGHVQQITTRAGNPMLVPAAIEAVRQWKYQPFRYQGRMAWIEGDVVVWF